jgi:hypothetical protein
VTETALHAADSGAPFITSRRAAWLLGIAAIVALVSPREWNVLEACVAAGIAVVAFAGERYRRRTDGRLLAILDERGITVPAGRSGLKPGAPSRTIPWADIAAAQAGRKVAGSPYYVDVSLRDLDAPIRISQVREYTPHALAWLIDEYRDAAASRLGHLDAAR